MIQISTLGFVIDPRTGQQILLLTNKENQRVIPIGVSLTDANNINLALNQVNTVRPLSHELLHNAIRQLGHEVERVEIDLGGDNLFFATIKLRRAESVKKDKNITLIANPPEAIALAIRATAPIFVSEDVMSRSIPADSSKDEQEREQFKQFVDSLKASDFTNEGLSNHHEAA